MRVQFPIALCLLCSAFSLGGCASAQGGGRLAEAPVREDFDPQELQDEDFLLPPADPAGEATRKPTRVQVQTEKPPPLPARGAPKVPELRPSGPFYRVQVAAVTTRDRAVRVQDEVRRTLGVPVVIQEDASLFRIQAGDLLGKSEVERLLSQAQAKGYPGAFVVPAPVQKAGASAPVQEEAPAEAEAQKPKPPIETQPSLRMVPAQGYRVQIFSVAEREEAQRFHEEARKRLGREDVYLQFEPPFFRVRVGNCRTRDTAEDLVRELELAGYEAPFPVRTQILVPEAVKTGSE